MSETKPDQERQLRRLVKRWRSRSKMFSEDDVVASNCAELCADELEEVLEGSDDD